MATPSRSLAALRHGSSDSWPYDVVGDVADLDPSAERFGEPGSLERDDAMKAAAVRIVVELTRVIAPEQQ